MSISVPPEYVRCLTRLGFEPRRERTSVVWELVRKTHGTRVTIMERSGKLKLQVIENDWSPETILKSLHQELVNLWGRHIRMSHTMGAERSVSVMVEISEPPSPSKRPAPRLYPPTVVGWTIKLSTEENLIKIFMEDLTVLGLNAPSEWPADLIQATTKAICGKAHRQAICRSIHEIECSALDIAIYRLNQKTRVDDLRELHEAFEEGSDSAAQFKWECNADSWHCSYSLHHQSAVLDNPGDLDIDIEILEARAAGEPIRAYDLALANRRQDLPVLSGATPVITKRKIIRYLQNTENQVQAADIEAHINEPAFASVKQLAAAALIRIYYLEKNYEAALEALRIWTECTRKIHNELESMPALSIALPELAGMILSPLVPEQALTAFERALNDHEEPRILARMADVISKLDQPEQELQILTRWRQAERRLDPLEIIIQRQVELQLSSSELVNAAANLEFLVAKYPNKAGKWIYFLNMLADAGNPQRSILILERLERFAAGEASFSKKDRIAISSSIARIWDEHLGRPDLALPRHEMVLEAGNFADEDALNLAESALERAGDRVGAMSRKIGRWRALSKEQRTLVLELGFGIMRQSRDMGDVETEFAIVLDLLESGAKISDLKERINLWLSSSLSWRRLLQVTSQVYPSGHMPADLARILAKVARDKLGDHNYATELLLQDGIPADLDDHEFFYLLDHLTSLAKTHDIELAVIARLNSPNTETRIQALKYLIQHTVIDTDGSIGQTLLKDWHDRGESSLILNRMTSLVETENIEALRSFLSCIEENVQGSSTGQSLIEECIDAVLTHSNKEVPTVLEGLLKIELMLSNRDASSLQKSARLMNAVGGPKSAASYINELIDRNTAPELSDSMIQKALSGDNQSLTAFYCYRMTNGTTQDRMAFARATMKLLERQSTAESYMVRAIEQLILSQEVQSDDLKLISDIARELKRPRLLVDSMISCAGKMVDEIARRKIFYEAAHIAREELADVHLSFELLSKAINEKHPSEDMLNLAKLAFEAGHQEKSRQMILSFLRHPNCLDQPDLIIKACNLLIETKEDRGLIGGVIQTLLSWTETSGAAKLGTDLTDFAILNGLASNQDLSKALTVALSKDDMHHASLYMIKIMERAELQHEVLADTVSTIKSDLVRLGFDHHWWQLIGEVSHGPLIASVSSNIRKELLCQYGLWLYGQDGRQKEALEALTSLNREDRKERRLWIPIYILLDELQENPRLIRHLERIIPKIEADTSILSDYPIHIETLKSSLKRAREKVNPKFENTLNSTIYKTANNLQAIAAPIATPPVQMDYGNAAAVLTPMESENPAAPDSSPSLEPLSLVSENNAMNELPHPLVEVANLDFETEASPALSNTLNWRTIAINMSAPDDAVERLFRTAFASETEKHIALQVAAILCGNVSGLDNWHWRVWRDSTEFGYQISARERMPKLTDLRQIDGPVHRFLGAFSPALARHNREQFAIVDRLRSRNPMARLNMRDILFTDPVLQRTGLKHHEARITQAKVNFVDTPELGDEVFLDAASRSIHFSAASCSVKPPGYLMHRAMFLMWSMHLQYHVILKSDALRTKDPLYQMFLNNNRASSLEKMRLFFLADSGKIQRLTHGLNRDKLNALAQQAGPFVPQDTQNLQTEMSKHIYRVLLAESLDLIGIFEALTGEIITTLSPDSIKSCIRKSAILTDLLVFATKLNL